MLNSSIVKISVGGGRLVSWCESCFWNSLQSTWHQFSFGGSGLWVIDILMVVDIGKWSEHGGWRSGWALHCVMRWLMVSLVNTLSGLVKFLVRVARNVGISYGSNITMLYSARRLSSSCKSAKLLAVNRWEFRSLSHSGWWQFVRNTLILKGDYWSQ